MGTSQGSPQKRSQVLVWTQRFVLYFLRSGQYFMCYHVGGVQFLGRIAHRYWNFYLGMTYFLVHDIFIHQRFKWFRNANGRYAKAVRRAHKIHHKHLGKEGGECFGMLWVPMKYFKKWLLFPPIVIELTITKVLVEADVCQLYFLFHPFLNGF